MKFKNQSISKIIFSLAVFSIPVCLRMTIFNQNNLYYSSADETYTLICNSSNRISNDITYSGTTESNSEIRTSFNNCIEVNYYQVAKNDGGWQTVSPNGYIYNPVKSSGNHNQISGIKSIGFESDSSKELTLYYGWSLDNEHIIYSKAGAIQSEEIYSFTNNHPSYFKLVNESDEAIDIDKLEIKYSCIAESYPMDNLNVLMIGNSFADDTIRYAKQAAAAYGITLNIHDAYIASCTLDMHYTNWTGSNAAYSRRTMNGVTDSWIYNDNQTLQQIVDYCEWDFITFQQASQYVGAKDSYSHLDDLLTLVRNRVGAKPTFLWHETWAYENDYMFYTQAFSQYGNDSDTMFNAIISAYQSEVVTNTELKGLIPAGTAVQNLRKTYIGESFSRDGLHMSNVQGRYLLALNFLRSFFGIDLYQSPCGYRPTGVNDAFIAPAYEAIDNANNNPLVISSTAYTQSEMDEYDLSNYTEIDGGLMGCTYWNSMDSTNYNKHNNNVKDTSNIYVASKQFTSSTLPVGSLVFVKEGYGCRPDGWKSNAPQSSKPDDVHNNVIEITDSFWDGYIYRAFNFYKEGKTDLIGQYDEIFDGVHFFVPNNKLGDLPAKTVNTSYSNDKTLFNSKGYDIDQFERVHLDPITGFYKCDSYSNLQNSYVDDTAQKFVCTRPFFAKDNSLPEYTVIIVDSGYQWRSDCWGDYGNTATRPGNISVNFTMLDSHFLSDWRLRTFNVSSTSSTKVGQNNIDFMNHMRIYVPKEEITPVVEPDKVTITVLGRANITGVATSLLGSSVPVLISLGGNSASSVTVKVNGENAGAIGYTYDKSTGAITIATTGSASGFTYGNITGIVNPASGSITNISIDGTLKAYLGNNGSITCQEVWGDRFNYSTNAASQAVWQRWYGASWTANSGSGDWTTSNSNSMYRLEEEYSMGMRIAGTSNSRTSFTLRNDFNDGSGIVARGVSIWLYNSGSVTYSGDSFRIFAYTAASSTSGDHVTPSSTYFTALTASSKSVAPGQWIHLESGFSEARIYNIRIFFSAISSSVEMVYAAHISLY